MPLRLLTFKLLSFQVCSELTLVCHCGCFAKPLHCQAGIYLLFATDRPCQGPHSALHQFSTCVHNPPQHWHTHPDQFVHFVVTLTFCCAVPSIHSCEEHCIWKKLTDTRSTTSHFTHWNTLENRVCVVLLCIVHLHAPTRYTLLFGVLIHLKGVILHYHCKMKSTTPTPHLLSSTTQLLYGT